ncbi:hypothetical protein COHA_000565 [Chlorella ohadii]|uniref:Uncharacterized protein n=1 Tax=Chlorella ohadii TaxID=2649997 RepID=A0AAD5E0F9_9CHLO|nr:hypothetical protein COHA_000565 [Chlorella ohadii]
MPMQGIADDDTTAAAADAAPLRSHAVCESAAASTALLGSSPMAARLRSAVAAAASDPARRPVLLLGEPGLGKAGLAAHIHHEADAARELPLIQIDCSNRTPAATEQLIFGDGSAEGLLARLSAAGGGTLLLNQIQAVPEGPLLRRLKRLLQPAGLPAGVRLIMTGERAPAELAAAATVIKVPPLRARPGDVKQLAGHFLQQHANRTGGGQHPGLQAAALRRLMSHSWPFNIKELQSACARVAIEADSARLAEAAALGLSLPAAAELAGIAGTPAAAAKATAAAAAGPATTTAHSACGCAKAASGACSGPGASGKGACGGTACKCSSSSASIAEAGSTGLATALTGPALVPEELEEAGPIGDELLAFLQQDREHSLGLNFVWSWWWPGMFLMFPLLGRWWCSVCPFMLVGEAAQKARSSVQGLPPLLKWPKQAESAGPWAMLALFATILVWEDGWHLPQTAALTGWLLVLISSGAALFSCVFPRRFWCRYVCPIGGMNGLFAKLSAVELRSQAAVCSGECSTYACLKASTCTGSADKPGCPMNEHSNRLKDNQLCALCTTCVSHCPHENVELRLRPPGIDLWTTHQPSNAEACLLFLVMGAVYLHHLPDLLGSSPAALALLDDHWAYCGLAALVLAAPGAALAAAHAAVTALGSGGSVLRSLLSSSDAEAGGLVGAARRTPLLSMCYSYVPLVWAATLAYWSEGLLTEAGLVLQVTASTAGLPADNLPGLAAHPAVVPFVQGSLLMLGTACSLALLLALGSRNKRTATQLPAHAAVMLAGAISLWTVVLL